jgi:superfamily II DNA or RNA helicase
LVVIDEAHHGVAGMWRKITDAWPQAKVLGVPATPEWLDGVGLGDAFDRLVLGPEVRELIYAGYRRRPR